VTAPNTAPLAALLASYPEECAAVVALLVSEGSTEGTGPWSCESIATEVDVPLFLTRSIVMVLCTVGIVHERGDGCTAPLKADRRAIARMGAAAWLRERVGAAVVDETTTDGEGEQR
jgi:hypothetical protein